MRTWRDTGDDGDKRKSEHHSRHMIRHAKGARRLKQGARNGSGDTDVYHERCRRQMGMGMDEMTDGREKETNEMKGPGKKDTMQLR